MVVEILISGLCAFVRESCATGNAKAVHVLMMKGSGGMEHKPRLLIESSDTIPPSTPTEVVDSPDGKQYMVWDLTGYRVEIEKLPPIGIYEGHRKKKPKTDEWDRERPNYSNPDDDFSWAPELNKTCMVKPSEAKLRTETKDEKQLPGYVVARLMRLPVTNTTAKNDNWLQAVTYNPGNQSTFEFHPKYRQVLADDAKLHLTFKNADPIIIRLVPYAGGETKRIAIRGFGKPVTLAISNLPSMQEDYVAGQPLDHFKAYWDLLKAPLDTCKVPFEPHADHVQPVKCTLCSACDE